MPDPTRRDFLTSPALMLAATETGQGAPVSDLVNRPDPLLSGPDLPTFRFALEATRGRVQGGNYGKEATVEQFPISKGIAGVSMRLEPGVMRELHWHATAAEWAFVLSGRCRTTVIDPQGRAEINDFDPGDVWYFPRGHGHSIQCLGAEPCHFILIFDNGYFSEFGTFSVTDWLGHAPPGVVARNLNLTEAEVAQLPRTEVYFASGPQPPEAIPAAHRPGLVTPPATHRYRLLAQAPHSIHAGGREWRVDAERFPVSTTMTGVILDLEPGGLRELHWHPNADEWQYLIAGRVRVTMFGAKGRFRSETLERGDVGYIPMGYGHSIDNLSTTEPARVLIALNTGHYQSIDLSLWLASNPDYVLRTNFGRPEAIVERLPRQRLFIVP
jgi:oxalate decarboxylase